MPLMLYLLDLIAAMMLMLCCCATPLSRATLMP